MEKNIALLLVVGIGGLAAYHLLKKPETAKFNAQHNPSNENTAELSREIESDANVEKVQQVLPEFGVPRDIIPAKKSGIFAKYNYTSFANASGFKNYVDVKNNAFFKPQLGVFHK